MSDQLAVEALIARFEQSPELVNEAPAWKVSLNFSEWQQKLGLSHALAAPIARLRTYSNGERVSVASDRKIHIEAEIALRLGADVCRASDPLIVDSLQPCLELVDYTFPFGDLSTLFSHSFFHAGVVLGLEHPLAHLPSFGPALPCVRNGGTTHERVPGTVPNNILVALGSLSERVLEAGGSLHRGQLVLCGSYAQPIAFGEGECVEADFGDRLGKLSVKR